MPSPSFRPFLLLAALSGCAGASPAGSPVDGGGTDGGFVDRGLMDGEGADVRCTTGQISCGGRCTDPRVDPVHCGDCDVVCAASQTCLAGACGPAIDAGPDAGFDGPGAEGGMDVAPADTAAPDDAHDAGAADGPRVCAPGQILCDARCVDPATDPTHCGGCGMACAAGQVCSGGACVLSCSAPRMVCGAGASMVCADLALSETHCGACGRTCLAGQRCVDGGCQCAPGQAQCGGACVTTATDRAHCGGCGRACPAAQSCVGGACACPTGQTLCAGACVDPASDLAHCGGCGRACPMGQLCNGGTCGVTCSAPRAVCGTGASMACVDPATSLAHCGGCGRACPTVQSCVAGTCQCPSGQTLCGDACVTTATDAAHCGVCNRACPSAQSCVAGACVCPSGQTLCGGQCVDTTDDRAHCGACGTACPTGQGCVAGVCGVPCNAPRVVCGVGIAMVCVDPAADGANCGQCGRACPSAQRCVAGVCACPSGQTLCGSACVDATSDRAHCGGCGRSCPTAQSCVASTCACPSGEALCGNACVAIATDSAHCGGCDRACPSAQRCVAGACQCPTGQTFCNGACVDAMTDLAHCGGCGRVCPVPALSAATCMGGACGIVCVPTSILVGGVCTAVAPPRPIAPLSTSTVTSRRPTLRWALATGGDGARLQFCRDRACSMVIATLDAVGTSGAPLVDLPTGVVFWRLLPRMGGATGTGTSVTWQFTVGARTAPRDTSWGTIPDVNGDGLADVLVGAPNWSNVTGRVHTFHGRLVGLATTPTTTVDGPDGERTSFGSAVASAGDVNGDGFSDVIVGAYEFGNGAGRAYLFHGGTAGLPTTPTLTLTARDGNNGRFGYAVAGAGDVNGDGYADVIVGAYAVPRVAERFGGRAYLYLGSAVGLGNVPAVTFSFAESGAFAFSVAGAGDVNGDGYADLLIGNQGSLVDNLGRVFLFHGSSSGPSTTATTIITRLAGGPNTPGFGVSVGCAGDVNGDGYADVVVGDDRADGNRGRALVYLGGSAGVATVPAVDLPSTNATQGDQFGYSVAGAGDINGDGFGDLVVGANSGDTRFGRASIYLGSETGLNPTPLRTVTVADSNGPERGFGQSVAGAGDVNGDGFADIVVGSFGLGRVYLYGGGMTGPGATPTTRLTATLSGVDTSTQFGFSVARVDGHGGWRGAWFLQAYPPVASASFCGPRCKKDPFPC